MSEAVIVSTARSPIGRAGKGSLVSMRHDDVATQFGYDFLPGTTVNRYCSSSLQTTRRAFHAIKAGEGDAFISAGVETVSRFDRGTPDSWPDTRNPLFASAQERSAAAANGVDEWHDPRTDGVLPDIYVAMGQTAENVALL